jgi:hypothetical protein
MISFGKLTKSTYEALTAPVQDRLYLIEDTGELLLNGKAYNGDADGTRDWLCITNTYDGTNTVKIELTNGATPPSLEYSTDGITWTTLNFSTTESDTITLANGEKVYFRGDNPNYHYGQWDSEHSLDQLVRFVLAEPSPCTGTVASLFSKDCKHSGRYKINNLFENCKITTPPRLDTSDTVQSYDYRGLFRNCTSLLVAPKLPAVNLGQNCYEFMFEGCTSLHVAPELPCTVLSASCYKQMFKNCTALWQCPELPALNLANNCYESMFEGCTDLGATMAVLPAANSRGSCYKGMFKNCTGIRSTPEIRLVTGYSYAMQEMFRGCSGLQTASELNITNASSYCCESMFRDCYRLMTFPTVLKPTSLLQGAYQSMFEGCTLMAKAPEIKAVSWSGGDNMRDMFKNCYGLNHIKVAWSNWDSSATYWWVSGVASHGIFECPHALSATKDESHIPSGWSKVSTRDYYASKPNAVMPTTYINSPSNVTLCPACDTFYVIDATQDCTLDAVVADNWSIGYVDVQLRISAGVNVTAGSNITFADRIPDDSIVYATVRWVDATPQATLYVTSITGNGSKETDFLDGYIGKVDVSHETYTSSSGESDKNVVKYVRTDGSDNGTVMLGNDIDTSNLLNVDDVKIGGKDINIEATGAVTYKMVESGSTSEILKVDGTGIQYHGNDENTSGGIAVVGTDGLLPSSIIPAGGGADLASYVGDVKIYRSAYASGDSEADHNLLWFERNGTSAHGTVWVGARWLDRAIYSANMDTTIVGGTRVQINVLPNGGTRGDFAVVQNGTNRFLINNVGDIYINRFNGGGWTNSANGLAVIGSDGLLPSSIIPAMGAEQYSPLPMGTGEFSTPITSNGNYSVDGFRLTSNNHQAIYITGIYDVKNAWEISPADESGNNPQFAFCLGTDSWHIDYVSFTTNPDEHSNFYNNSNYFGMPYGKYHYKTLVNWSSSYITNRNGEFLFEKTNGSTFGGICINDGESYSEPYLFPMSEDYVAFNNKKYVTPIAKYGEPRFGIYTPANSSGINCNLEQVLGSNYLNPWCLNPVWNVRNSNTYSNLQYLHTIPQKINLTIIGGSDSHVYLDNYVDLLALPNNVTIGDQIMCEVCTWSYYDYDNNEWKRVFAPVRESNAYIYTETLPY